MFLLSPLKTFTLQEKENKQTKTISFRAEILFIYFLRVHVELKGIQRPYINPTLCLAIINNKMRLKKKKVIST